MALIQEKAGTSPSLVRMLAVLVDSGVKLKSKRCNLLFKLIGKFAPNFNKNVFTTIGNTIWLPSAECLNAMNSAELFRTLGHEYVHAQDAKKQPVLFYLSYAFPQWLAMFGLLGFLGFYSYPFFLFFTFFVFLMKLPSPRLHWELRAFAAELMLQKKLSGALDHDYVDTLIEELMSPTYHMTTKSKETLKDWLLVYAEYAVLTNTDTTYIKLRAIV